MKKVCLVKGGNFVLGIETQYILSRQNEILPPEIKGRGKEIFHLGSLLARKHCRHPEPGSIFLHLQKEEHSFFLAVDQVIDEIELPEQTTRLPPPSPALAEQLFPQIAVCMNLIVLLLDPARIVPVAQELGNGVGLLPADTAEYRVPAKKRTVPLRGSAEAAAAVVHQQPAEKTAGKGAKKAVPVSARCIQKHKRRPKSVDEETFQRVMTWTINQFRQGKVGPEDLLAEQLPPGLVRQKGVSDSVIQYLIDQISLRCQESITPSRSGEQHGG